MNKFRSTKRDESKQKKSLWAKRALTCLEENPPDGDVICRTHPRIWLLGRNQGDTTNLDFKEKWWQIQR